MMTTSCISQGIKTRNSYSKRGVGQIYGNILVDMTNLPLLLPLCVCIARPLTPLSRPGLTSRVQIRGPTGKSPKAVLSKWSRNSLNSDITDLHWSGFPVLLDFWLLFKIPRICLNNCSVRTEPFVFLDHLHKVSLQLCIIEELEITITNKNVIIECFLATVYSSLKPWPV